MLDSKIKEIVTRLNLVKYLVELKEIDQIVHHITKLKENYKINSLDSISDLLVSNKYDEILSKIEHVIHTYTSLITLTNVNNLNHEISNSKKNNEHINLTPIKINKKWGFINELNEIVIECDYDSVYEFNNERAIVKRDNKYGIIDRYGVLCSNFDYDDIRSFSEGFAGVMRYTNERKAQWGFVNKDGVEVIKLKYQSLKRFSEGLAMVELNDKVGFIDYQGKLIIDFRFYTSMEYDFEFEYHNEENVFIEGRCKVYMDKYDKEGIINNNGDIIISYMDYDDIRSYSEGLAAVNKKIFKGENKEEWESQWGFVDYNGNEVIECKFNYVGSFKEGYAPVCLDSGWGYINKKGFIVIPCKYKAARPFSEGLAAVYQEMPKIEENSPYKNFKWGFIDYSGKVVIPFIHEGRYSLYESIPLLDSFKNGLATVKKGWDFFGKIDKKGNIVEEFRKYNYSTGEYESL